MTRLALLGLVWLTQSGHVGTSQVVFEGQAGGYPVRVMISPPGVVPAQVPIQVRVLEGTPTRVTVRAAQWNVGTRGAPPAEDAVLVPGDPGVWAHSLWVMTSSSYAVYVAVAGPAGGGELVVPMQTSATRTLGMQRGMALMLAVLGTLLVAGMLSIIGSAAREGTLTLGEQPSPQRIRGGRVAMASATALLALALFGGSRWWDAEERDYRRRMLKPIGLDAQIASAGSEHQLTLAITDSLWRTNRLPSLLPDHGKLMHLFLIGMQGGMQDSGTALAHLHPLRVHADTFVTRVPALPTGRYLLFGDLLFESGAQRTLVDTIDVPSLTAEGASARTEVAMRAPVLDRDDAWRTVAPVPFGQAAPLAGGGLLTLTADRPVAATRDLRLQVRVTESDGQVATLEPYMGMGGHAMIVRADGAVFIHLHPMGTASMAAQAQLIRAERGDTAVGDHAASDSASRAPSSITPSHLAEHSGTATGDVPLSFPFAFPSSGEYLVFVQVRRAGVVETAAFRVAVPPAPAAAGSTTPSS